MQGALRTALAASTWPDREREGEKRKRECVELVIVTLHGWGGTVGKGILRRDFRTSMKTEIA